MIEGRFPAVPPTESLPEAELHLAAQLAMADRREARPLQPTASLAELRERFALPLPAQGRNSLEVLRDLADAARPGLTGSTDPGFLAWVIGGSHPAGVIRWPRLLRELAWPDERDAVMSNGCGRPSVDYGKGTHELSAGTETGEQVTGGIGAGSEGAAVPEGASRWAELRGTAAGFPRNAP